MKNILLIGIGGTGSSAVDILYQKIESLKNKTNNQITAVVFDTSERSQEKSSITRLTLSDNTTIGTVCDRIGTKYLHEWFPCNTPRIRARDLTRDSSLWRKSAYLSFLNLLNKHNMRAAFHQAMEDLNRANPEAPYEIYMVSSLAGGTGSGLFLPIALYAQHYIHQQLGKIPQISAIIACPDIFVDKYSPDIQARFYTNAYAFLRELNAINLVTHGYNRDAKNGKKAPIHFRLGAEDEPLAGILFDSDDENYWRIEAAPFSKIFVLDKISGVHSVEAHKNVLADTLYTILCTDVGKRNDSEYSNHVMLSAQNNGGNAIFSGIATSQVQFPTDSILSYLAHEKAFSACQTTWLILHNRVKELLREKERQARRTFHSFNVSKLEYAQYYLNAYEEEKLRPFSPIPFIVTRGASDGEEHEKRSIADRYFDTLLATLDSKITSSISAEQKINENPLVEPDRFGPRSPYRQNFIDQANQAKNILAEYLKNNVEYIQNTSVILAENILNLNEKKEFPENSPLCMVSALLSQNKQYLHPVSAMLQLCQLRVKIDEHLRAIGKSNHWDALIDAAKTNQFYAGYVVQEDPEKDSALRVSKSYYEKLGENRLLKIAQYTEAYLSKKTHTHIFTDSTLLRKDAIASLRYARQKLSEELQKKVLESVIIHLDILIEAYRNFFERFDELKSEFALKTKKELKVNCGKNDNIINILSSEQEKQAFLKKFRLGADEEDITDILRNDDIVGKQVFLTAYDLALASKDSPLRITQQNVSGAIRNLFQLMVEGQAKTIQSNSMFRDFAKRNLVEAIVESCDDPSDKKGVQDTVKRIFFSAHELAKPTLQVDCTLNDCDSVCPSDLTVLLMSYGTASYIKKHANLFDISIPHGAKEEVAVLSCAEQFGRKFVTHNSRVSVIKDIPDQIIYITGEKLDIAPHRIFKFNEFSNNASYYESYCEMLKNIGEGELDLWNPHLGFDLHKPGRLPFIHPNMEQHWDEKIAKALLFGIMENRIYLKQHRFVYCYPEIEEDGNKKASEKDFKTESGDSVTATRVSQIFFSLKKENGLVECWSDAFDQKIKEQKSLLPPIYVDTDFEIESFKNEIVKSVYFKRIFGNLFPDIESGDLSNINILEFAYIIKNGTTAASARHDAEQLLRTAYRVLIDFCEYWYKMDASESMRRVYMDILDDFIVKFCKKGASGKKAKTDDEKSKIKYASNIIQWANQAGTFRKLKEESADCIFEDYPIVH